MTRMILAAVILAAAARTAPAVEVKGEASPSKPIAVLSMYAADALPRLLANGAAHKALAKTPLYIGQYGVSPSDAEAVHKIPNARYAPIFTPKRDAHPERVHLTAQDKAKLANGPSKLYEGRIPADLLGFTHAEQRLWGLELGRRLRDGIRAQVRAGVRIDSWQFDEVSPTPAGKLTPRGVASRWFVSGVLHGLCYGRPELDDKKLPGLVFVSGTSHLGRLPDSEDARMLFWELDHVALALLGEEYPVFRGDPAEAARRQAEGQRLLRAFGDARARLAGRYVPAMTPGYNVYNDKGGWTFLGGNADGLKDDEVDAWREAYVAERARLGVSGFGEYNFSKNNDRPAVIRATVSAVADGVARLMRKLDAAKMLAMR